MAMHTVRLESPVDLEATLGPLQRGPKDPTMRVQRDGVWRATRTPEGPATEWITLDGATARVRTWGPGGDWAIAHASLLLGAGDEPATFRPRHAVIADAARRLPGMRIARTEAVFEALLPAILEQKVPGVQAWYSYRRLIEAHGEAAPGDAGLRLPPAPDRIAAIPSWTWHRLGVEGRRADTVRGAALVAGRLEQTLRLDPAQARERISSLRGVGPWSAAEVTLRAFGDADAVSVGDFHLPHMVAWALLGRARGTDALMLELLEPYRGHRGRVLRLLEAAGIGAPRFGPRMALRWIARS